MKKHRKKKNGKPYMPEDMKRLFDSMKDNPLFNAAFKPHPSPGYAPHPAPEPSRAQQQSHEPMQSCAFEVMALMFIMALFSMPTSFRK